MKFFPLLLCLSFALAGCGGSDSSAPAVAAVTINGLNSVANVNEDGLYDLVVDGIGDNITVADNNTINVITLSGLSNLVTIGAGVTVVRIDATGSNNTLIAPIGSNYSFIDTGLGNQYIEQ